MTHLPIVCTLTSAALAARKAELLPRLMRKVEAVEERSDGYRFRFAASSEILQSIAAVIEAERRCCRFLQFQLTIEPGEGPIWLTLSGPPGTAEFLAALMDV